ncbi:MAG: Ig-like domain-containing protein [bacterium]
MAGQFGGEGVVNSSAEKGGDWRLKFWVVLIGLTGLLIFCLGPDTTPPRTRIDFPQSGDTVSGNVKVTIYATDNRRVERVEFFVDESLQGKAQKLRDSVFEFIWDVSGYTPGGEHDIFCVAFDWAGNCDSSAVADVVTYPSTGTHHQGTIVSEEFWTAEGNPHYVYGDLRIEAVVRLEPGVEVRLMPGAKIVVGSRAGGGLRAIGEEQKPIRFMSAVAGESWQGLWFFDHARSEDCILSHCVIEEVSGTLLTVADARIKVENCSLRICDEAGVVAWGMGFAQFNGNVVSGCGAFPVVVDAVAAATLGDNNRFNSNGTNFVQIRGGEVWKSGTWKSQGVPYLITGTVTVAGDSNPMLTVAAGCSLLFADSVRLRIGTGSTGTLVADGTYGTITFSGYRGKWQGIEFWNRTGGQTVLKNCIIDYGGGNGVAAIISYVPVNIVGTRITNSSSAGAYLFNCGFNRFEFNTITGCADSPLKIEAPYVGSLGSGNNFYSNGKNYIEVFAGTITNDQVWLNHYSPYYINGMVEVGSILAPMLSIGPGVTLIFGNNSGLRVGEVGPGKLVAIGVSDSIVFTGDTNCPGAWRGIDFALQGGSGSVLDHCRILYGSGGGAMGIVTVRNCSPTITNNEIAYSAKYCLALFNSPLNPDSLRQNNWLHDWNEECDDIYEGEP